MHPDIDPLNIDTAAFWLRLAVCVGCGLAIGIERQLRGKAAGIRTSVLVCMGTMLYVAIGMSFPRTTVDPTRVLGQVITGIGFLGAGVILVSDGRILGITSAAVIWVLAAIGALVGVGRLGTAMVITLTTLGILIGLEAVESVWKRLTVGRGLERIHLDM